MEQSGRSRSTTRIWISFWQFVRPHLGNIKKLVFWPSWSRIVNWANKRTLRTGAYLPKSLFYNNLAKKCFRYPSNGAVKIAKIICKFPLLSVSDKIWANNNYGTPDQNQIWGLVFGIWVFGQKNELPQAPSHFLRL